MKKQFAISIVGRDQPGIIAAISRALLDSGCNLKDTNMSVLSGHFSMVLIADAAELRVPVTREALTSAVLAHTADFRLMVSVAEIKEDQDSPKRLASREADHALVAVYGVDRPGIVHAVASAIASTGSNITDLRTKQGEPAEKIGARPLYSLFVEVAMPPKVPKSELHEALKDVPNDFGVEVSIQDVAAMEL